MLAAAWLVGLLHGFKVDPEKIRARFSKAAANWRVLLGRRKGHTGGLIHAP
jgi:hypothetical protein